MSRKVLRTVGTLLLIIGVIAFGLAPAYLIPAAGGHGQSYHWVHVAVQVYWVSGSLGLLVGLALAAIIFSFTNSFHERTDNKPLHSTPR
jgi:hypothetical protein